MPEVSFWRGSFGGDDIDVDFPAQPDELIDQAASPKPFEPGIPERFARDDPGNIILPGDPDQGPGDVFVSCENHLRAEFAGQGKIFIELTLRLGGKTFSRIDAYRQPGGIEGVRHPPGPSHQGHGERARADGNHEALAGVPDLAGDPALTDVPQLLVDPLSRQPQGDFPQGGEVAFLEKFWEAASARSPR